MADQATNARSTVSLDDVKDLEDLLADLKAKASDAHDRGLVIMHDTYVKLLQVASPIVNRTQARLEREALADQRKKLKALRASKRTASPSDNS